MSMFNIRSKSVEASTCTTIAGGASNYEIALVLDNSGSMNESVSGNSKIAALRTAATNFINTMFNGPFTGKVKMSIVPFAGLVLLSSNDTSNVLGELDRYAGQAVLALEDVQEPFYGGLHQSPRHFQKSEGGEQRLGLGRLLRDSAIPAERQRYASDERDARHSPKQTCTVWYRSTTQAYQNNYINDTSSSGCSGTTTPTDDQSLTTRSCKYKSPSVTNTNTYGANGMCLSQPLQRLTPSAADLAKQDQGADLPTAGRMTPRRCRPIRRSSC